MLKVLPFNRTTNAKCAEIYCQSLNHFTIVCAFCELKSFEFEDFLLHFKNAHFENNLLKMDDVNVECTEYLQLSMKREEVVEQQQAYDALGEDDFHWDDTTNSGLPKMKDCKDVNNIDIDSDVDNIGVGKVVSWQRKSKRRRNLKKDLNEPIALKVLKATADQSDYDNVNSSDDDCDYKPLVQSKSTIRESKCQHCERIFNSRLKLTQHLKDQHEVIELFTCAQCNLHLQNQRSLDQHLVAAHNGIPCLHCERKYKTRAEMRRHTITHTGVRNLKCNFEKCEKKFLTKRQLADHRKTHTDPKNFVCENCGYSCQKKETLRIHIRIHTGERPYSCEICSKSFPSQSRLCEHKATHSTERPHICQVCGASFARQKALYHHKFLHLDLKKFKCKICGNAYAQASGLAGHMRKHKEGVI